MFLHHDYVDNFGVLEGKETKSTRAASHAITHDRAFRDLAKLGEVVF
jgi:hypothetical protein